MTDIQNRLFEDLCLVKEILDKNGIVYYLGYGTLLGAVRHKGFIPWDDDIDILIKMEDLPRLREVFTKETGRLKLHDHTTHSDYPYSFPKIVDENTVLKEEEFEHLNYTCGVYIDVFPLVQLPDNMILRKTLEWQKYFYYGIIKYVNDKHDHFKGFHRLAKHLFSLKRAQVNLEKNLNNHLRKGEMMTIPIVFAEDKAYKKSFFDSTTNLSFEGVEFSAPIDYVGYLETEYGDYMQLPPLESRVSNHSFSFEILE